MKERSLRPSRPLLQLLASGRPRAFADENTDPFLAAAAIAASCAGATLAPARASSALVPVKVVKAEAGTVSEDTRLAGDVQAKYLSNVAFRVNGKIAERLAEVGDHVRADQVIARLEPQEQQVNVDTARAALNSAEALLAQAKVNFERQETLMRSGYTTRPAYDQAEQQLRTTQASVDSSRAALGSALEQLSYTELRTGADGIVTARSAEAGQVVSSGQTVFTLAQDGPRDAVFTVPTSLLVPPPPAGRSTSRCSPTRACARSARSAKSRRPSTPQPVACA